jgi:predicted mannosyl-3-phosphoglycerate phosphatase (HAD superfamily)
MIAGENAETTGVKRQRSVNTKLGAEVSNRMFWRDRDRVSAAMMRRVMYD